MSNNGFVRRTGSVVGVAVTCLAGGSVATASAGPDTRSELGLVADWGDVGSGFGAGGPIGDTFVDGGEIPDSDDLLLVDSQLSGFVDTLDGVLAVAAIELTAEVLLVVG